MSLPPKVRKVWERIDPWRGYYTYEIDPKDRNRARVIDLIYITRDPEENEKFLKIAKDFLKKHGFHFRTKISRTSNVFGLNVSLIVFKDEPFTKEDEELLDKFDELYTSYYTAGFSIFTGETYPLDFEGFKRDLERIGKKKLEEVI